MKCGSCGRTNRSGARFCDNCGTPLADATTSVGGARKVVTILFADLVGSTTIQERADAESVRRMMDQYYAAARSVIAEHGGTLVKVMGDGVMAVFGIPNIAEDDALRAVHAAVAAQAALDTLREKLGVSASELAMRVGVNTGEVVVSDNDDDVVGDPVNVAARLEQAAEIGGVLIGDSTRQLVFEHVALAPAGALTLKGRADPVHAFRVESLDRAVDRATTPFVGREAELEVLTKSVARAQQHSSITLTMVIGSPGLGKSRLLDELRERSSAEATVLYGRCDSALGLTFAPIADALRTFAGIDDSANADTVRAAIAAIVPAGETEHDRIASALHGLLAGAAPATDEAFWVLRRLLALLARDRTVLLVIDDLHWAEPLLLDLVEHLVEFGRDSPICVVGAARPELRDARPALCAKGELVHEVVLLDGLNAAAATRLAADVIGTSHLAQPVAEHVLRASEGNPLFLRELVRMLVEDGAIVPDGDHWVAAVELTEREMPPTIHALLAARLERLQRGERTVLEHASVIGKEFSRAALSHLLPAPERNGLDAHLEALCRREFVEREPSEFLGDRTYRFHHVLIRDAAYRRVLKRTRAELHREYADWLEEHEPESFADRDETLGWHLERAHEHLVELGPLSDDGRAVGARAAQHLAAAGRRALARDDVAAASGLLGRALNCIEPDDSTRAELALDWCEACLASGDVVTGRDALAQLDAAAGASPRLRAWHTCFDGQLAVMTEPQRLRATVDAVAVAAHELQSAGDNTGEAKAHWVHALALASLGEVGQSEAALDRALAAARNAGDRRRANAVLAGAPQAALWGPSPVTRASGRCLDVVRVLRITSGAPAVEAVALRCQAVLEALRERTDAARRMVDASRRIVEDLGVAPHILQTEMFAGLVELLAGDADAAERHLRTSYEGLAHRGLRVDAAQAAALLARTRLVQGDVVEAEALSHASEELAGDDLKAGIAWRGVRAEALARRGDHEEGVALASAAVAMASSTDALLDHADARVALSVALRAAGQLEAADAERSHAHELWAAKGATTLSRRADPSAEPALPRRIAAPNAATANVERFRAAIRTHDRDALRTVLADESIFVHLPLGVTWNRDGILDSWETFLTADDIDFAMVPIQTIGDSLALLRGRRTMSSYEQWGPSDTEEVVIIEVDAGGRRIRTELYEARDLSRAITRLHELADHETRNFENAATRALATFDRAWAERDWDAILAATAPNYRSTEERLAGVVDVQGDEARADLRKTFEFGESSWSSRVIAIRGERLALLRRRWRGEGKDFAQSELEFLDLIESDDADRLLWEVAFNEDDLDGAFAELDGRYVADEGAPYRNVVETINDYCDAAANGDWERVAARLSDDFTATNTINTGPSASRDQWLTWLCTERDELGVVGRVRMEHFPRLSENAAVALATFSGTRDGGTFSDRMVVVFTLDGDRLRSTEAYDPEDLDLALARYEELTRSTNEIENAATRAVPGARVIATRGDRLALVAAPYASDRLELVEVASDDAVHHVVFDDAHAACEALDERFASLEAASAPAAWNVIRTFWRRVPTHDVDTLVELAAPGFVLDDHRPRGFGKLAIPDYRGMLQDLFALAPDIRLRIDHVIAIQPTAALNIGAWVGTVEGGPFEIPLASVTEHATDGRATRWHAFAVEDLPEARAVFESVTQRVPSDNAAVRAMRRLRDAAERADWDAARAACSPRLVIDDRRPSAQYVLDREQFLADLPAMYRGANLRLEATLLATSGDSRALEHVRWSGGSPGEEWLIENLLVIESDAEGRVLKNVGLELDQRDEAERELRCHTDAPHPARAARARSERAFDAGDWTAMRALTTPDFVYEDRRAHALVRGDADVWVKAAELIDRRSARYSREAVTELGATIAVDLVNWKGTDGWEADVLQLTQVDERGQLVASINFDPDDRRAAFDEALQRFRAGEAAPYVATLDAIRRYGEAFGARDLVALRSAIADDFVFHDHRVNRLGRVDGADTYIQSVETLHGLAPEVIAETLALVAIDHHGRVGRTRIRGEDVGGGAFESEYYGVFIVTAGKVARYEFFDSEDSAMARFAELKPPTP
ncbi:MAG TPA: nuclear transport factor 2 family protein [Acidimicrobiia bacterium]|jgi:class 3 adenylate cyclase|nr:nuclear transport factor 2 family protein [Acidimicrobiia bacterium]